MSRLTVVVVVAVVVSRSPTGQRRKVDNLESIFMRKFNEFSFTSMSRNERERERESESEQADKVAGKF